MCKTQPGRTGGGDAGVDLAPAAEEEKEKEEKGSRGIRAVIVEEVLGMKRWKNRALDGFPPFLSSLDKGGRPGFDLVSERRNGRLVIVAEVAEYNNCNIPRGLVRAGGPEGGAVKMGCYCDE